MRFRIPPQAFRRPVLGHVLLGELYLSNNDNSMFWMFDPDDLFPGWEDHWAMVRLHQHDCASWRRKGSGAGWIADSTRAAV